MIPGSKLPRSCSFLVTRVRLGHGQPQKPTSESQSLTFSCPPSTCSVFSPKAGHGHWTLLLLFPKAIETESTPSVPTSLSGAANKEILPSTLSDNDHKITTLGGPCFSPGGRGGRQKDPDRQALRLPLPCSGVSVKTPRPGLGELGQPNAWGLWERDKDSTLGPGGDLPSSTGRRSPRWDLSSLHALCLPSGCLWEVIEYPLLTHSSPHLSEACAPLGRVTEAVESAVGTSVCSWWARCPHHWV